MKPDIAFLSRAGGRMENQDCVGYVQEGSSHCLVVADGVGGYRYGEYASALAVQYIKSFFHREPKVEEMVLRRHIEATASRIADVIDSNPALRDMCTTLCVAYLNSQHITVGNIGDTRFYLFKDKALYYVSQDHSLVMQMVREGRLSPGEIRGHPKRNVITSAIGRNAPPILDTVRLDNCLCSGDGILLCSDGFWELILEDEMLSCLVEAESAGHWLQEMERRIGNRLTPQSDNYSCLAVMRR